MPGTQYETASQQREIVNRVLDAVLATVDDLDRSEIAALEWSSMRFDLVPVLLGSLELD